MNAALQAGFATAEYADFAARLAAFGRTDGTG
jgi:hypothetical protein